MTVNHSINPFAALWRGRRVGLLGGSFNPAHQGHLLLSRQALVHLALDEVWWMVSPQNPLKSVESMAPLADRVAQARAVAANDRIRVTDIEVVLGTRYTAETLQQLCRRFPATDFVWLMGADNMAQISHWKKWNLIFASVPVAVFGRPHYSLSAMSSKAARQFAKQRIPTERSRGLVGHVTPAWTFIHYRHDPVSATAIRAGTQPADGLRPNRRGID
ncbi:MAG: nicotinate-nucleotide adenylyltransferase [Proteobacteria bacterium]|nr:nicotinate-nucleotide adenylyltransferase [Pseudomonadota bacterium]